MNKCLFVLCRLVSWHFVLFLFIQVFKNFMIFLCLRGVLPPPPTLILLFTSPLFFFCIFFPLCMGLHDLLQTPRMYTFTIHFPISFGYQRKYPRRIPLYVVLQVVVVVIIGGCFKGGYTKYYVNMYNFVHSSPKQIV